MLFSLEYECEFDGFFRYKVRRHVGTILCCTVGRHSGNYLALTYILVKVLYIANAIGQLFLLNVFLGRGFSLIGIETINRWWHREDMDVVERFPRITMCRFIIRTLGDNIQPFDVQCLLPINIYNEKIFLLIWFWLAFVAAASVYGLIKWFYYFTTNSRRNFIQRYLQANEIRYCKSSMTVISSNSEQDEPTTPKKHLEDFVENYCRQDGLLLLRIIKKNTNNVIAGEIICALWDNWKVMPQIRFNKSDNGGRIMGLGGESPLKQKEINEVHEKLLA
jgi:hypothetical protein